MNQEQLFNAMQALFGKTKLTLPPESFKTMDATVTEYIEDKSIEVTIPLYEKYNNPAGLILGGYFATFFDLAFGPLSFLVAKKPTTSLDLNTTFIRPLLAKDKQVIIQATVVNKGKSYLILDAKALNPEGKLVATATSRMQILG